MRVYYNEFDVKKAASLKALMDDGFITNGDIDTRPIQEVRPDDLRHYDRCHFFAGIGLWDYALNLTRWPENLRVWTGSCPCQPFSAAGRKKGKSDDRHLWPFWFSLIQKCQPPVVFGEQVATAIAHGWLDDVYQGLEAEDYAVGSAVLPACSVGAPHKRDRLWFVAHAEKSNGRRNAGEFQSADECQTQERPEKRSAEFSGASVVGNAQHNGSHPSPFRSGHEKIDDGCAEEQNSAVKSAGASATQPLSGQPVVQSQCEGLERYARNEEGNDQQRRYEAQSHGSAWATGIWIDCPDEKQRLVEPSIHLLADGHPERVGLLHSAGDAIVPQLAAKFIECSMAAMLDYPMQNASQPSCDLVDRIV